MKVKEVFIMCKQKRPPESVNERGPYEYEVKEALETISERGPKERCPKKLLRTTPPTPAV